MTQEQVDLIEKAKKSLQAAQLLCPRTWLTLPLRAHITRCFILLLPY